MTIGNYDIGFLLGKGADGEVRLATDNTSSSRKQFAVKILKIKTEEDKIRFKRELDVTKSLNHENIIKFHDVKEEQDCLYLFMDLVKGTTLEKFSENDGNGLSESTARPLFVQLANALSFIHSKGICHRDLKLENVLVDEKTNKVFLIDFGYCGLVQNGSSNFNDSVGSPLFNSPEKVVNQLQAGQSSMGYCGKTADVWSLGICLFYMLNGYYPFFPHSTYGTEELYEQILNGQLYANPFLSPEANDLLSKMLEKNPSKRISVHQVLEHPFVKARNSI